MTRNTSIKIIWAAACVFIVAGMALALQARSAIRTASDKIARRASDTKQVAAIEADLARCVQAQMLYGKLATKKADSFPELLKASFADQKTDDARDVRRDLIPGWYARQKELTWSDVQIGKVMEFAARAESMRPPWIMTKCQIRSSQTVAGMGQVTIVLEAVERKD
ncbi:MAG: hypothetical protein C0404_04355 [Verrucomicrobia bacterium]|nr:hypothetical protein [Verrucomicrobiota bacterium]